jgi:hypothetical protein
MSTTGIDLTILCICGQPATSPYHGDGPHQHRWLPTVRSPREDQEVKKGNRLGHYSLVDYRIVAAPPPAIGTDPLIAVPGNAVWRVQSLQAQLTTDAVNAARVPHLVIQDSEGRSVFNFPAPGPQPQNLVQQYSAGATVVTVQNDGAVVVVLPSPVKLLQGWKLGFKTTALDAGDQWANVVLYIKEWLYF